MNQVDLGQRLHKLMATAGVASRRESERLIAAGRVQVNNVTVTKLGTIVNLQNDVIKVDGQRLRLRQTQKQAYYVLHKPRRVVTTMSDPQERRTIVDVLPKKVQHLRIYPVGRLDYDVSGCLLLTNDGELAYRLTHPKYGIARLYRVKVKGVPDNAAIARLGRLAKRAKVVRESTSETDSSWRMTLFEGKYHQVKRLWQAVGHPVDKMSRLAFAGIPVGNLAPGQLRELTAGEVIQLKRRCDL